MSSTPIRRGPRTAEIKDGPPLTTGSTLRYVRALMDIEKNPREISGIEQGTICAFESFHGKPVACAEVLTPNDAHASGLRENDLTPMDFDPVYHMDCLSP